MNPAATRTVLRWLVWGCLFVLLLAGCDRDSRGDKPAAPARELIFYSWADDLPPSLIEAFSKEFEATVVYRTYESSEEAVRNLRSGAVVDVAVIENQFIPELVADGTIAALEHRNLPNLQHLSENFRELVFDPGNRYSVTFNWGLTALLVRDDLTPLRPTRWADLWDPRLAGRVQVWDLQRPLVGMALKSLGYSINSENPAELDQALERLVQLKARARTGGYVPSVAEAALADGRTAVIYGYSGDLLRARARHLKVSFVVPAEGAIQWTDNFVVPATSTRKPLAEAFINFLLRPENSARIVNEQHYPTANEAATPFIRPDFRNDPAMFPSRQEMLRAEVLMPLSREGQQRHDRVWQRYLAAPGLAPAR